MAGWTGGSSVPAAWLCLSAIIGAAATELSAGKAANIGAGSMWGDARDRAIYLDMSYGPAWYLSQDGTATQVRHDLYQVLQNPIFRDTLQQPSVRGDKEMAGCPSSSRPRNLRHFQVK